MRRVLSKFFTDRGTHLAAMIAYFALLSFVPLLFLALALLGLVHQADEGSFIVDAREELIERPADADRLGLGMVYQHFTLVPSMTAAENLVMARADVPRIIDWKAERARLETFLEKMPFRVPLDVPVGALASGERQKTEILKQLYLQRRFLVLDEPTSVLTPQEADEVLTVLRALVDSGELTILMITHDGGLADQLPRRIRMLDGRLVSDSGR